MDEIVGMKAAALIATLTAQPETARFESKRVSGKMVGKALETICAFANTAGGTLALGLDDLTKTTGPDRLYGLAENPEAVDELRRKTLTHLLPANATGSTGSLPRTARGPDGSPDDRL